MDMRGHGETVTRNSHDLSSGTLAQVRIVDALVQTLNLD